MRRPVTRPDPRGALRPDCARCAGLCCVAPGFAASADFPFDKPAGQPCPNLLDDFRCGIHDRLRASGFPGCSVFDCFGAGQQVVQVTFAGRDWRAPAVTDEMFRVFAVMRLLHEVLWYLAEAEGLARPGPLRREVVTARLRTERLRAAGPDRLGALDTTGFRDQSGELLGRVSAEVRARIPGRAADRAGADLTGARLAGADLHGASLRGSLLIGADLTGAHLGGTDLLGTDLRGARLDGADLRGCLFLTRPRLEAARGDRATRLPRFLPRPSHWVAGDGAGEAPRGARDGDVDRRRLG